MTRRGGRVNAVRRGRGYRWEAELVNKLLGGGYAAYRLGGTTTGLPDVIAWPLISMTARQWCRSFSIECKSTASRQAYVPAEQIRRIREFADAFPIPCFPVISVMFRNEKTGRRTSEHHLREPTSPAWPGGGIQCRNACDIRITDLGAAGGKNTVDGSRVAMHLRIGRRWVECPAVPAGMPWQQAQQEPTAEAAVR